MTQPNCQTCGTPLPAASPGGLCPRCLLKRGMEANTAGFTAPEPSSRWLPPEVAQLAALFPELEIMRLLGRGGMGAVYQARQKDLDRVVALKILPPEMGHDPAFAQRFTGEAQAMARLNHPHIVTLYEFGQRSGPSSVVSGPKERSPETLGETSGLSVPPAPLATDHRPRATGLYFFIMEYVDGVNLRGLLDSGHVSPKEALAIVPQICEALQYAHEQGIVHRDIKPENILLSQQGVVKIADFGLAKLMGRTTAGAGEKVIGTPRYMAPEQLAHPADVDHRADIYSLGVVFYQMLTGELPAMRLEPPSRKVQIDVRLDQIVLRALEQSPELRFQNATQFKTEVETVISTPAPSEISNLKSEIHSPAHGTPAPSSRPSLPFQIQNAFRCIRFSHMWLPLAAIFLTLAALYAGNGFPRRELIGIWIPWLVIMLGIAAVSFCVFLVILRRHRPIPSLIAAFLYVMLLLYPIFESIRVGLGDPLSWVPILILSLCFLLYAAILIVSIFVDYLELHSDQPTSFPSSRSSNPKSAIPSPQSKLENQKSKIPHHLFRWTARILGTLFTLLILTFIIAEGSPPLGKQPTGVQIEFAAMALWLLGFILGWRFEALAAFLILLASATFHFIERRPYLGWALELPTLIGLLYLAAFLTNPRHDAAPHPRRSRILVISLLLAGTTIVATQILINRDRPARHWQAINAIEEAWRLHLPPDPAHDRTAEYIKHRDALVTLGQLDKKLFVLLTRPGTSDCEDILSALAKKAAGRPVFSWTPQSYSLDITVWATPVDMPAWETLLSRWPAFPREGLRLDPRTGQPIIFAAPAFAPLIEMVLPTMLGTDLDTGKIYSDAELPENSDMDDEFAAFQWRQRTGVDVAAVIRPTIRPTTPKGPNDQEIPAFTGLLALDTRFAQVADSVWDASPAEIQRLFDTVLLSPATIPATTAPSRAKVAEIPTHSFPATYLFHTRQGRGILQILGTSDNPQGLRARIRSLMTIDQATTSAPASANAISSFTVARAKELVDRIDQFQLTLRVNGDIPALRSLILAVPPAEKITLPNARTDFLQITPQEAQKIINYLKSSKFLDRANNTANWQFITVPRSPGYSLDVGLYSLDLGWGEPLLRELRSLRQALDEKPTKALDQLIEKALAYAQDRSASQPATAPPPTGTTPAVPASPTTPPAPDPNAAVAP